MLVPSILALVLAARKEKKSYVCLPWPQIEATDLIAWSFLCASLTAVRTVSVLYNAVFKLHVSV